MDTDQLKHKVTEITVNLHGSDDLDLQVFEILEKQLDRELIHAEKSYIRYLLDQDAKSRHAISSKGDYSQESKENWK